MIRMMNNLLKILLRNKGLHLIAMFLNKDSLKHSNKHLLVSMMFPFITNLIINN